ncbi:Tartrate-resistant acid phosphatase type 5, partial [Globisporangium splendens]
MRTLKGEKINATCLSQLLSVLERQDLSRQLGAWATARLYFDGGARVNPGPGGSGWALIFLNERSNHWELKACGYAYMGPEVTDNWCEYSALKDGLAYSAHYLQHYEVKLEVFGDSQMIIAAQNWFASIRQTKLQPLAVRVNQIIANFAWTSWDHTKREQNKMADLLANMATSSKSAKILAVEQRGNDQVVMSQVAALLDNDMPARYYVENIKAAYTRVTVDIFNVDTNAATVLCGEQICFQCYGYKTKYGGDASCNNVGRSRPLCASGDTDMFDACLAKLEEWQADSLRQLSRDAKASTATWKVVNSHYSPHFHMAPPMMQEWNNVLAATGVHLFMNGHTHAESHEYGNFKTHFVTNSAGGGIQSESISEPPDYATNISTVWIGHDTPYGIFELYFGKQQMKPQFVTFDGAWEFKKSSADTVMGGCLVSHCWLIPKDGSKGEECGFLSKARIHPPFSYKYFTGKRSLRSLITPVEGKHARYRRKLKLRDGNAPYNDASRVTQP